VPSLASLAGAWSVTRDERGEPDWTRLRAFLDYLKRHPEQAPAAIEVAPVASGLHLLDNLLAGIAEKVADDAGAPRPTWTQEVTPLHEPWEGLGTPRMRAANAVAAPPQLVARNILIPAASLWR
jgi:hypothetical protein